jgi:hypothetical protein
MLELLIQSQLVLVDRLEVVAEMVLLGLIQYLVRLLQLVAV